jgi:hypothetical protein
MTAGTLLISLWRLGVQLEKRGAHLHVDAPVGTLTPELRNALVEHRDAVLAALDLAGPGKPVRLDHLMKARGLT